ncbi:unnamed protein product [Mesocestoides corti]|uniref:Coiled-coil domain-containing protein 153 n=1 Tax=Mesocestoides corti TaxID=53468 RepID=A0A0R3U790_MESCO|nr:unnamed protein product [Mesocestoides corti]
MKRAVRNLPTKKKDLRTDSATQDLAKELGIAINQINGLTLREAVSTALISNLKADKVEAKRVIQQLRENITVNTTEAKLATACVNAQYKLLQRLFILRVHESKETIAKLKKENFDLKAESNRIIKAKNDLLKEKDEQISKLEAHLQSLHFQLEQVVLDMAEKMEKGLEEDRLNWEKEADSFHESSVRILQKLGYGMAYL